MALGASGGAGSPVSSTVSNLPSTVDVNSGNKTNSTIRVVIATDQPNVPISLGASLPAGNNNIGDIDVVSLPSLPAGNNNIGDVDIASMPSVVISSLPNVVISSLPSVVISSIPSLIISSSALPSGAATTAKQDTGNTSLASIDSRLSGALTVSATDLDIRNLSRSTDAVEIYREQTFSEPLLNWAVDSIAVVQDGSWSTNQAGNWDIRNVTGTVSLPTGASTAANQSTGNTSLAAIATSVASIDTGTPAALGQATMSASMPVAIASNQSALPASQSGTWIVQPGNTPNTTAWKVDGSAVTHPVSIASLPLPSGASTSALQTTGNSSLASIDSKLTAPLAVVNSYTELTGTATATDQTVIAAGDVRAYKSGSLQLTGTFGGDFEIQQSNDNSNWKSTRSMQVDGAFVEGVFSTTGIYTFQIECRFLRVRTTSWSIGTAACTLELSSLPLEYSLGLLGSIYNTIYQTESSVGAIYSTLVSIQQKMNNADPDAPTCYRYISDNSINAINLGVNGDVIRIIAGNAGLDGAYLKFYSLSGSVSPPDPTIDVPTSTFYIPPESYIDLRMYRMIMTDPICFVIVKGAVDTNVTPTDSEQISLNLFYAAI